MKKRLLLIALLSLSLAVTAILFNNQPQASALAGSSFNAGRIIDDVVFFNSASMDAQTIQTFLNSKVPICDTNGTQTIYDSTQGDTVTRAVYSARRGISTPFTCLKDYRVDATAKTAETGLCGNFSAGNFSSAELIYLVSQACGINPQVLIVLLQKEQTLVTDDWPWPVQYQKATGYGCPDTAPCDTQYYGLFNQIWSAARQFKRYARDASSFNYRSNTNSYILYNPNTGCGGSNVLIQNQATANLYNYTPYQPNTAALNNLYGTGDGCSAYGNRNFWRLFNDWFGPTYAPDYAWRLTGQYAYTDNTKTTPIGIDNLAPGQRIFIGFTVINMGNTTWTNSGANPLDVGLLRPTDRNSDFFDPTWLGPNRPGRLKETSVEPGQTATFEFWITAPTAQNTRYNEYFGLVKESVAWLPDIGMYFGFNVQKATYSWQLKSQYAFTDQTKSTATGLGNMSPGQRTYVGITAKNTGNVTWLSSGPNPVFLGTSRTLNRPSAFMVNSGWQSPIRAALMKEASVAPGQTATFEFWMTAPNSLGGNFYEYFNLVSEGKAWMEDLGLNFSGSLVLPTYLWNLNSQYAYSDNIKTTPIGLNNLTPGQTALIGVKIMNTGSATWFQSGNYPLNLGTTRPTSRFSPFYTTGWPGYNRPVHMAEQAVKPGQLATFEFIITAPSVKGNYLEYFTPVVESMAWLQDIGLNFNIQVK